ncbi:hypothetical protein HW49_10170 [Porphyromonadaceae bacterium COT-184 OH4590]|nr:hypothetical protein HW49_10170 [Porphyromonadaceae bacterium COT-184 OH4590]
MITPITPNAEYYLEKEGKKPTKTGRKAPEKRNFFAEKVIFLWQNPKNTRQCSAKGGRKESRKKRLD